MEIEEIKQTVLPFFTEIEKLAEQCPQMPLYDKLNEVINKSYFYVKGASYDPSELGSLVKIEEIIDASGELAEKLGLEEIALRIYEKSGFGGRFQVRIAEIASRQKDISLAKKAYLALARGYHEAKRPEKTESFAYNLISLNELGAGLELLEQIGKYEDAFILARKHELTEKLSQIEKKVKDNTIKTQAEVKDWVENLEDVPKEKRSPLSKEYLELLGEKRVIEMRLYEEKIAKDDLATFKICPDLPDYKKRTDFYEQKLAEAKERRKKDEETRNLPDAEEILLQLQEKIKNLSK